MVSSSSSVWPGRWNMRWVISRSVIASVGLGLALTAWGIPERLGDFDEDGRATVLDVARLQAHVNGRQVLPAELVAFGDLNQDGFINHEDVTFLSNAVLGFRSLEDFPLSRVHESSPSDQESDVALTRETILRFTQPMAPNITIGTNDFFAESKGRRLLARAELSIDRKSMTLVLSVKPAVMDRFEFALL
jgi:hypothetical protein